MSYFDRAHTTVYRLSIYPVIRPALLLLLCTFVILLQGCAQTPLRTGPIPLHRVDAAAEVAQCENFFSQLDQTIAAAGVRDAEQALVQGFPYLRVDRFLSSLRTTVINGTTFDAWVDRLQALDRQARSIEVANLPPATLSYREQTDQDKAGTMATIDQCGTLLRQRDMAHKSVRDTLRQQAIVPVAYQTYKRILGLYPISAQVVLWGVKRLHEETSQIFNTAKQELPIEGELVTYRPPPTAKVLNQHEVATILAASADNPLGVPQPDIEDRKRLFNSFAPIWEIDIVSDNDRIGSPQWRNTSRAQINIDQPQVYQRISHTQFQGRVLLQLNYQLWFPARPRSGAFDLLGGHLDGITWRVTLAPNGEPILLDAIHNCGCYHMYFPSPHLHYTGRAYVYDEPLLIPRHAPPLANSERLVVRIAHTTHYLQHLSTTRVLPEGKTYELEDYDVLRSLPLPSGGYRSLFGPDGIVAGTERGERWVFWPMGVPEPGAMRQWGHHATAFVGRRHFNDPDLLDRYFDLDKQKVTTQLGMAFWR